MMKMESLFYLTVVYFQVVQASGSQQMVLNDDQKQSESKLKKTTPEREKEVALFRECFILLFVPLLSFFFVKETARNKLSVSPNQAERARKATAKLTISYQGFTSLILDTNFFSLVVL